MNRRTSDDRGSVTAELAIVLPVVLVLLVAGIGAMGAGAARVRLEDAAADAARLVARADDEGRAAAGVAAAAPGARLDVDRRDDIVCATASATVRIAGVALPLRATSCALDGGL
jgi:Flp pilus assembly protein TadG